MLKLTCYWNVKPKKLFETAFMKKVNLEEIIRDKLFDETSAFSSFEPLRNIWLKHPGNCCGIYLNISLWDCSQLCILINSRSIWNKKNCTTVWKTFNIVIFGIPRYLEFCSWLLQRRFVGYKHLIFFLSSIVYSHTIQNKISVYNAANPANNLYVIIQLALLLFDTLYESTF